MWLEQGYELLLEIIIVEVEREHSLFKTSSSTGKVLTLKKLKKKIIVFMRFYAEQKSNFEKE